MIRRFNYTGPSKNSTETGLIFLYLKTMKENISGQKLIWMDWIYRRMLKFISNPIIKEFISGFYFGTVTHLKEPANTRLE